MTSYAGKAGKVEFGSGGIVANVTAWSISEKGDQVDTTVMGQSDDFKTHIATLKEWDGSFDCDYDAADADGQVAATANASVTLKLYPEGSATGKKYFTGTATITGTTRQASVEGKITFKSTFKGNGALSVSTAA